MRYLIWGFPTWAVICAILLFIRKLIWGVPSEDPLDEPRYRGTVRRASEDFGPRQVPDWSDDPDQVDNATGMPVEDILAGGVGTGHGVASSDE